MIHIILTILVTTQGKKVIVFVKDEVNYLFIYVLLHVCTFCFKSGYDVERKSKIFFVMVFVRIVVSFFDDNGNFRRVIKLHRG